LVPRRGRARPWPSQLILGRYLAEGVVGEQNPVEARWWFEQAAAQGIEEAQADLAAPPTPDVAIEPGG
jgi:hypothetical protein